MEYRWYYVEVFRGPADRCRDGYGGWFRAQNPEAAATMARKAFACHFPEVTPEKLGAIVENYSRVLLRQSALDPQ